MVQTKVSDKLRGGYYTPAPIADFICRWAIEKPNCKILEPSCGDGNFVEAAIKRLFEIGLKKAELNGHLTAVELMPQEAEKAKTRLMGFGGNPSSIIESDFFSFIYKDIDQNPGKLFDVIIGNPPFIRYQDFPEEHRSKAIALMNKYGLNPNRLTNIWVPFLIISANLLSEKGKLGMVIPAELFQVKYAEEARVFLSNYFEHLTVITFKKLVFNTIQQEVVLLLGERKSSKFKGIRFLELNGLDDLQNVSFDSMYQSDLKTIDHNSEKWTKYFLEQKEIDLLRTIRNNDKILTAEKYLDVDVGIVTGRNEFFMLNKDQVKQWSLEDYVMPVVSKSPHLKGVTITKDDFAENVESGNTAWLFIPPDVPFDQLPLTCQKYIEYGESMKFNDGYKCRVRKRWYITPSLKVPHAFALRQVDGFPKLILNESGASSTDTIHRVLFRTEHEPQALILSFLNSLTFAFSEITGRSYGGGVLTFEPTEIEALPLPILSGIQGLNLLEIEGLMRKKQVEKVLDLVDDQLLIKQYGFSKCDVQVLRGIWRKLAERRGNRKRRV